MEVLRLENVSKYYTSKSGVVMGLSSINLSFKVGEFVAITGESGSGKSTMAHILGGIIPYESGEMYIYGTPTSHYGSSDWEHYRRDYVSFISQNYGILVGNTVLENVESALRFGGMEKEETRKRALEILEEVDLLEFKSRKAGKLSSGQKQRLSIARALAKPSKVLIADEPTGNLDRENSEKVIKLLHKASKDRLVILITHEFSEAEDYATRRIILSDAVVVTDAPLRPAVTEDKTDIVKKANGNKKALAPYVTYLTIKSRPIFTSIVCLLLALTTMITFVFLGTFTVALDDTTTKIYNDSAFTNGDPTRIVILHPDKSPITKEELKEVLDIPHVENVIEWSRVCDFNYYYKEGTDHRMYQKIVPGPDYHPATNPEDLFITNMIEFMTNDQYLSTVPITDRNIIKDGRAPEGIYEILSADPEHRVGDTVTVHIRNRKDWSLSTYISLNLTVVGKTSYGEGLYISDKLAGVLNTSSDFGYNIFLPYVEGVFELVLPHQPVTSLTDDHVIIPGDVTFDDESIIGKRVPFHSVMNPIYLTCQGVYNSAHKRLYLVSQSKFDEFMPFYETSQSSVFMEDYSYTDRVIDDLNELGYLTVSPFRAGAVNTDTQLAIERIVTLAVCMAAFVLTLVLQIILMKAMFNSVGVHYKLMSNIGLTAKTAYASVALMMLIYTLVGEFLGMMAVVALNSSGFSYVVSIFKYLDFGSILLLIASHFALCALSLLSVYKSLKNQVFKTEKADEDIDFVISTGVKTND
jgi:ABC-type lipoprotein export system ATPase subunit